ncbi:hypothetical protein [Rhizobium metallidurans]|uniref:Uncharacterized protein n=1 Tax=Rhizobium metallidurans TaxID=1265931 RepID=A0A7W6CSN7_9HYPH|nr:hypothetical protein [Rhizobium metallidurans]MBB3965746.1 hypothetical protein [Rhizobium metallidurans]
MTTREQERKYTTWLEQAEKAKRQKADSRRNAKASRLASIQSLPERLAAQAAMIEAHGGRLPPRWRYEPARKKVKGELVEYYKRIVNRPAYIPTMPYDPEIDGRRRETLQERAAERRDRIDVGFRLSHDVVLSGHLVSKGLEYEGYKSESLGTRSALRWPALVHRSSKMRVCWHRGNHSDLEIQVAAARANGVPEWMLAEHGIEMTDGDVRDIVADADDQDLNMRVLEPAHHKVLGLDAPTVEGNKTLFGFLRIDTDLTWRSVEHLMRKLRKKVEDRKIRSLPNFIVGIKTDDGRLIRPHLIWLLPIDMGVLNVDNKHLRLFKAVYYGLCHALADLGADPQAPATSQLTKNPLSPLYHTECLGDEWPTLTEHASCLEMGHNRVKLIRESVATVTGETFRHSNEYLNGCMDAARGLMARWLEESDPVYVEAFDTNDHGLLIHRLQEALSTLVTCEGMRSSSMEYARYKVATWIVETWNPSKVSRSGLQTRGRLGHIVEEIRGTRARQAVAGQYSAKVRADKTLGRLLEAWDRLSVNGVPSKSALARESGLTRQTVHNRYDDLQAAITERGVKDAVTLYGRVIPASPEKISITTHCNPIEEKIRITPDSEAHGERDVVLDDINLTGDGDDDLEALTAHEIWIAKQEGRMLHHDIRNAVSASVGPASRQWRHDADAPAADVSSETACANSRPISVPENAMLGSPICSFSWTRIPASKSHLGDFAELHPQTTATEARTPRFSVLGDLDTIPF